MQHEVEHYITYLTQNFTEKNKKKTIILGLAKGKIIIKPNFDDPILGIKDNI